MTVTGRADARGELRGEAGSHVSSLSSATTPHPVCNQSLRGSVEGLHTQLKSGIAAKAPIERPVVFPPASYDSFMSEKIDLDDKGL